jgi:ribose/xylose/arabinose/galactoside ABC-type transport system permease subunit
VVIPVPLVLGLVLGILNGVLIGKLGLNSFLVTLAGYFMWDSLSRYIMMGHYFPPGRFDPHVLFFGRGRIMDGPFVSTIIFIGLLSLTWFFMKYTKKGNAIYAVGASMDTARRLGINIKNIKLLVHAIAGLFAGICGLFYVGYAVEIKPVVVPPFYISNAFVAIAIAGISLSGGRGRVLNTLGGAILIAMTAYGATMMGAGFEFAYYVVPGTLFLVVIVLINRLDAFRDRILSRIYVRFYTGSVSQVGRTGSKET